MRKVFYELFNEPFLGYYDGLNASDVYGCYAAGGCAATLNDGVGSPAGYGVEASVPNRAAASVRFDSVR